MNDLSSSDQDVIQLSLEKGLVPLSMYRNDFDFFPRALALMQTYVYEDHLEKLATAPDQELQEMASILRIADWFDQMTAMNSGHEPMSEIAAMQYFKNTQRSFFRCLSQHLQSVFILFQRPPVLIFPQVIKALFL